MQISYMKRQLLLPTCTRRYIIYTHQQHSAGVRTLPQKTQIKIPKFAECPDGKVYGVNPLLLSRTSNTTN